jgi:hypothetical protein
MKGNVGMDVWKTGGKCKGMDNNEPYRRSRFMTEKVNSTKHLKKDKLQLQNCFKN